MNEKRILINQIKNTEKIREKAMQQKCIKVIGNSMLPNLHENDIVYILQVPQYKVGDVVVFENIQSDFKLSVHRIVFKLGKIVVTKGDNNLEFDESIMTNKIIGKIEKVINENEKLCSIKSSKKIAIISMLEGILAKVINKEKLIQLHKHLGNGY